MNKNHIIALLAGEGKRRAEGEEKGVGSWQGREVLSAEC